MFPATIFDFNGVLIDDEHVHLEAFRDTLLPLGIEVTEADYWEKYLGFDDAGAFDAILRDAGSPPQPGQVEQLIEAKRPHYLTRAQTALKAFPEASRVVAERASAGPVVVVSGALRDEIELGLNHLGRRADVGYIVAAEDTRASKPDPEGYRLGKEWLARNFDDQTAGRALVIEDSIAGIEAAKAVNLPVIAVAHSYPLEELGKSGADRVLSTIAQITPALLTELYTELYG